MVIKRSSGGRLSTKIKEFKAQGMTSSQALEKALADQEKEEQKKRKKKQ